MTQITLPQGRSLGAWQSHPSTVEFSSSGGLSLCSCSLFTPCLVQSPPPGLQVHTPGPGNKQSNQPFQVLFQVLLRQEAAQEPGTHKLPWEVCTSPLPRPPEPPSLRPPSRRAREAVLTSRKRFQYLSGSYWETVLSHWSLSRKLPLGPAPPASASTCGSRPGGSTTLRRPP